TVPEVIAARHMNMKVFGISVITDLGVEGSIEEISHEDVIENAKKNEKNLVLLVKELVKTMH
ncbi:MAG: purine-nucleoside phosphorylase, partial [Dokdonia sp.]